MKDADLPRRFTGLVDWRELWETMMSNSMLKSAKVECKDLDPTVYVAIELSRTKWLVAVSCTALSDASRIHQLAGGDVAGLVGLIDGQRQTLAARGVRGVRVISCFEAGYDGFWLHRQLLDHDVESHVIDCASLLVDERPNTSRPIASTLNVCCGRSLDNTPAVIARAVVSCTSRPSPRRTCGESAGSASVWCASGRGTSIGSERCSRPKEIAPTLMRASRWHNDTSGRPGSRGRISDFAVRG